MGNQAHPHGPHRGGGQAARAGRCAARPLGSPARPAGASSRRPPRSRRPRCGPRSSSRRSRSCSTTSAPPTDGRSRSADPTASVRTAVTAAPHHSTRRGFIGAGASAAAAAALGAPDGAVRRRPPERDPDRGGLASRRPRVRPGARTPNMDALVREGIRFTRAHPEAMPTVPGAELADERAALLPVPRLARLARAARLPGLGAADRGERLPARGAAPGRLLDGLRDGQPVPRLLGPVPAPAAQRPPLRPHRRADRRQARRSVGARGGALAAAVARAARRRCATGCGSYLANGQYSHDEAHSFAARVFTDADRVLDRGARRAALRDGGGHLRAARAVDARRASTSTSTAIRTTAGPSRASRATAGSRTTSTAPTPRACSRGCTRSTRPR